MKKQILTAITLFLSLASFGQHTLQGKIEFERSMNLHRTIDYMDEDRKEWIERFRDKIPKYNKSFFDLSFNTEHGIYKPGRESEGNSEMWFARIPAEENIVYTDYRKKQVTAYKHVYEEKFLVKDTMRKIEWKIYDEIRTIANYKCRKAVGLMFDSVYVVAFYTEDIPVSGGPEMFGNLPGMILEVAIPRLHTTWIATKVEFTEPEEKELVPPKKGKETNVAEMHKTINGSMERWGKYGERIVWWSMI